MPYKSGFCDIGAHEGLAPKNKDGKHIPTCRMSSDQCSCECHVTFDKMYEMTNTPRVLVDHSGYVPDRGDFVMPSFAELARERESTVQVLPSEAPELTPVTIVKTFNQTPTGRAARGELESQVNDVCTVWAVEQDPAMCTPGYISDEIVRTVGIKAPSVGAIGAVFDRWAAMEYAVIGRKPVRFLGFTDRGRSLGLDGCKEAARAAKRRSSR